MEANLLPHHFCYTKSPSFLLLNHQFPTQISLRHSARTAQPLKATPTTTTTNAGDEGNTQPPPPPQQQPVTPEIRFRRGSRKRSKQKQQDTLNTNPKKPPPPPKKWEDMTFTEKALELYVGEKGLLFWLNKFAYASIFIIIGGWILFRFVGPSLGLYQLDTPPLSPTDVLKGG